jgi:hypothetical protein
MSIRILWVVALVAAWTAIVAGGVYAYRLPSGQHNLLPLIVAAPAVLLAKLAWRQVRRTA